MMAFVYFLLLMIPIVVVHELGHYYAGRRAGIAAEVFSIGFGPEIYSKTDRRGTKWRLAAIPFGGFVKFAPDVNGTNFPSLDPEKPRFLANFWGKIFTIFAGPLANFILSFVLFFAFATLQGPPSNSLLMKKLHLVEGYELNAGERLVSVNGTEINDLLEFYTLSAELPSEFEAVVETKDGLEKRVLPNPQLAIIAAVIPGEAADIAGLQEGDMVIGYGETQALLSSQIGEAIREGGANEHDIRVLRGDEELTFPITPQISKDDGVARIGIYFADIYETAPEKMGAVAASSYAFSRTNWVILQSYEGIKDLVTGELSIKALSGPVGIGRAAEQAASQGFWVFIFAMGWLSSAVGFMNLLPIPILDGGHIILLTYERIFGRLPPSVVINFLFALGIALLLGILLIVTRFELFG